MVGIDTLAAAAFSAALATSSTVTGAHVLGAAAVLSPLPNLLLGGRQGVLPSLAAAIASACMIAVVTDLRAAEVYVAAIGVPAFAAVWALRSAWKIEAVVVLAAVLCASCLLAVVATHVGGVDVVLHALRRAWRESFDAALALYRDAGVSPEALEDLVSHREEIVAAWAQVLPGAALVGVAALWIVNLRLSTIWLGWPQLTDLRLWQAPAWWIWLLLAGGFGSFAPFDGLRTVSENVFLVLLACYFCQGLAIVSYHLQRFGLPRGLRVASYLLIPLQEVVAGIVLVLGVFDLWGDFRRLQAADASTGQDMD